MGGSDPKAPSKTSINVFDSGSDSDSDSESDYDSDVARTKKFHYQPVNSNNNSKTIIKGPPLESKSKDGVDDLLKIFVDHVVSLSHNDKIRCTEITNLDCDEFAFGLANDDREYGGVTIKKCDIYEKSKKKGTCRELELTVYDGEVQLSLVDDMYSIIYKCISSGWDVNIVARVKDLRRTDYNFHKYVRYTFTGLPNGGVKINVHDVSCGTVVRRESGLIIRLTAPYEEDHDPFSQVFTTTGSILERHYSDFELLSKRPNGPPIPKKVDTFFDGIVSIHAIQDPDLKVAYVVSKDRQKILVNRSVIKKNDTNDMICDIVKILDLDVSILGARMDDLEKENFDLACKYVELKSASVPDPNQKIKLNDVCAMAWNGNTSFFANGKEDVLAFLKGLNIQPDSEYRILMLDVVKIIVSSGGGPYSNKICALRSFLRDQYPLFYKLEKYLRVPEPTPLDTLAIAVSTMPKTIKLLVKTFNRGSAWFTVNETDLVASLATEIYMRFGISREDLELRHGSKVLEMQEQFADYSLKDDDSLIAIGAPAPQAPPLAGNNEAIAKYYEEEIQAANDRIKKFRTKAITLELELEKVKHEISELTATKVQNAAKILDQEKKRKADVLKIAELEKKSETRSADQIKIAKMEEELKKANTEKAKIADELEKANTEWTVKLRAKDMEITKLNEEIDEVFNNIKSIVEQRKRNTASSSSTEPDSPPLITSKKRSISDDGGNEAKRVCTRPIPDFVEMFDVCNEAWKNTTYEDSWDGCDEEIVLDYVEKTFGKTEIRGDEFCEISKKAILGFMSEDQSEHSFAEGEEDDEKIDLVRKYLYKTYSQ